MTLKRFGSAFLGALLLVGWNIDVASAHDRLTASTGARAVKAEMHYARQLQRMDARHALNRDAYQIGTKTRTSSRHGMARSTGKRTYEPDQRGFRIKTGK
ncbi:MAG: hypothetical protein AAGE61_16115 [Pseudomonadota bacterium]